MLGIALFPPLKAGSNIFALRLCPDFVSSKSTPLRDEYNSERVLFTFQPPLTESMPNLNPSLIIINYKHIAKHLCPEVMVILVKNTSLAPLTIDVVGIIALLYFV